MVKLFCGDGVWRFSFLKVGMVVDDSWSPVHDIHHNFLDNCMFCFNAISCGRWLKIHKCPWRSLAVVDCLVYLSAFMLSFL